MKKINEYIAYSFFSWEESGETAIALGYKYTSGIDYWWFDIAINCMRDGDMGEKGEDGVYDRVWYTDSIEDGKHLRPSTKGEVELWLSHCYNDWVKMCKFNNSLRPIGIFYLPTGPIALLTHDK